MRATSSCHAICRQTTALLLNTYDLQLMCSSSLAQMNRAHEVEVRAFQELLRQARLREEAVGREIDALRAQLDEAVERCAAAANPARL